MIDILVNDAMVEQNQLTDPTVSILLQNNKKQNNKTTKQQNKEKIKQK